MRVAVMGAGSMGSITGALMTKNGADVVLIDANPAQVAALNEKGATITGKMDITIPVKAITPDQMEGIYDLVIYFVKQTHNESALKQVLAHIDENSAVVTMQNGVPEDAVAEAVGAARTLGCPVSWGATWISPGVSMLTSEPDKMDFDLGEMDGSVKERTKAIQAELEKCCPTHISTNLAGNRWSKLLINSTLSGMSAVLGCTFGEVLDSDKATLLVTHIGNEILKVATARGITLEPLQGHQLTVLGFANAAERVSKLPYYRMIFGPHRALKASMLQDLEKGLKTEIAAINGVPVYWGEKLGIPTPINNKVVEIIRACEAGTLKPEFKNLDLMEVPEIE